MSAVYETEGGFVKTDNYTPKDIPQAQAPALVAVVTALAGMDEPWQAVAVIARASEEVTTDSNDKQDLIPAIALTVEAVHVDNKGRRIFTPNDYPQLMIKDAAALAFFDYFTQPSTNN